jgi:hypothetical protein
MILLSGALGRISTRRPCVVTLEQRVLAIKAKFEEATTELLGLVSEDPSRVLEVMRFAESPSARAPQVSGTSELVTRMWVDGEQLPAEHFLLPWTGRFLEISRRGFRHEKGVIGSIPTGEVFVLVNIWSENTTRPRAFHDLNKDASILKEHARLQVQAHEAEITVGKV